LKSKAERELITIDAMIFDYCRSKHQTRQTLCPDCQKLIDYATNRIVNCKLGKRKTTCAQCPVHCLRRTTGIKFVRLCVLPDRGCFTNTRFLLSTIYSTPVSLKNDSFQSSTNDGLTIQIITNHLGKNDSLIFYVVTVYFTQNLLVS
jgi:hypothetical protein